jgi:hypothetical protein
MKVKGVDIVRADPEQVESLMRQGAVKRGTRSVTFIAFEGGAEFVEGPVSSLLFHSSC